MNKIGMLSALAVATAAGTAMAQPVLKFRTITESGGTSAVLNGPGSGTVRIYVQARVDNWHQGLYQSTSTSGAVNNSTSYGATTAAREQLGWSIAGLLIRSTENALGGMNAGARTLDKGVLTGDQFNGSGDPRLTSDPTWQNDNSDFNPHFGWTRLLRAGVAAQGENTPGNGVRAVIGGKLAVVGSTTDNSVSVTDLNLTADLNRQGTHIGLNSTGTNPSTGNFVTLYVLEYNTTDFATDDDGTPDGTRNFDITVAIAQDQSGNKLAGLYFRNPNSGTNQGQLTNEMVMDALADNTIHVSVVVPAPGAAALLGLGGLIAARRRRS